jgi:hypothetical protein
VFGATYWYDSAIYVQLAHALTQPDGLTAFYSGPRYYIFQHLMPGLPLLMALCYFFFSIHAWIALAVFQHIVAAIALFYFINVTLKWLPRWASVFLGILIALHPFYAAFHNAPLTESLSGSFVIFGLAFVLDIIHQKKYSYKQLIALTGVGILATQFRSYIGVVFIFYLAIIFFLNFTGRKRLSVCISAILIGSSVLAFPIYRSMQIEDFFMPNVDNLILGHVMYLTLEPSDRSKKILNKFPYPPDLPMETVFTNGLDFKSSAFLAGYIDTVTESNRKTRELLSEVARKLRFDTITVIINQLRLNLSSIGFNNLQFCCDKGLQIRRGGYTWKKLKKHAQYYYKWHSWRHKNYQQIFQKHLEMYRRNPSIYDDYVIFEYGRMMSPYIFSQPIFLRDPFFLNKIPTDLWVLCGLIGLIFVYCRSKKATLVFILPIGIVYISTLIGSVVGNIRYAYPLMPLYFFLTSVMIAEVWLYAKKYWQRAFLSKNPIEVSDGKQI